MTCRVLKLARQPYYRGLAAPVGAREVAQAHLANALFDTHRDDPEFGHRLLADEAARAGLIACDRTVWRMCRDNQWWSVFGKKRSKTGKKAGPPAHDDLVHRQFKAEAPNRLWLWDITEHPTAEGKVYLCAIKDMFSGRIVGYSISDRMTSQIAVDALVSAVQRRGDVAGCVVTTIEAASSEAGKWPVFWPATTLPGRWGRSPPPGTTLPWRASSRCCRRTSWTAAAGRPATSCAWRSSPGSNGPTTAADVRSASAA